MKYFDVLDSNGNFTGNIKTRDDVHKDGDWHGAVHVWVINSKKQILIKKRPDSKKINPGKWDVSLGGHIVAGDDSISAAIRETKEKLNIDILERNLKFLFTRKDCSVLNGGKYIDNEISDIFIVRLDIDEKKLTLNKKEAVDVKFVDIKELKEKLLKKDPEFVIRYNECLNLFDKI